MPARKHSALHTRHSTKPEIEQRTAEEESMLPGRTLPDEPRRLKDHPIAAATWRRLMREFNGLEAVLVTRLDMDLLIDYCMMTEQLAEIDQLRRIAYATFTTLSSAFEMHKANGEDESAERAAIKVIGAFDAVIKLDGRADRKRDLLLKLRQSLYLTPRARAAAAPKRKESEIPEDPFEKLLNELPGKVKVNRTVSGEMDDER